MPFEEFLHTRLAGLLGFASALTGSAEVGAELVEQALLHGETGLGSMADPDTIHAAARAWVVRGYLSAGMRLGAGVAPDVDTPAQPAESAADPLAAASRLRRATLLLRYGAGLPDAEIARAVGSPAPEMAAYLDRAVGEFAAAGVSEQALRQRLRPSDPPPDAAALLGRIRARLAAGDAPEHAARVPVQLPDELEVDLSWVDIVDPNAEPGEPPPPPPDGPPAVRAPRRRWAWCVLGAAIVLAAAGVTTAAAVGDGSSAPPPSTLPSPVSAALPGSRLLAQYAGTGPATLRVGALTPGAGQDLALGLLCRGAGAVSAGPITVASCSAPVLTQVPDGGLARLVVRAPRGTHWRVAIVAQPQVDTNGTLAHPPDPSLAEPRPAGVLAAAQGSGAGTVALPSAGGSGGVHRLRISLTCRGGGVALSSPDGSANGRYTRTCFAGWSYEFDVVGAQLPGTLQVSAAAGTSWRLAVVAH